ncbi:hypothetical protein SOP90_07295 [Bacillus sp. DAG6]|uniref:hypothetical protein n=1 Tax=Bacillus sp. DAG6 TaxID=3095360 RepID=UPI002B23F743|nr:hypothetical protein [Bacillus sp. DAG6]MEB2640265.1 hypothetical protein [Bacillus sp. DAG6]
MLKGSYNYHELENEYERIIEFINLKPKHYIAKNKNDFEIDKEQPITLYGAEELIKSFKKTLEHQNNKTKLDMYRGLKPFDKYLNHEIEYFKGLNKVKFPFGFREFVNVDIPHSKDGKGVITSYYTFTLKVINHTIEELKKKYHKQGVGYDNKYYFTLNFVGSKEDKGWINAVNYVYTHLTKQVYNPENKNDDDALMEATKMVNFAAIKLAYSGLIKEHYTKMVILTHPRVSNGEIGVYRTNDVGDGLGIDYMLKNSNGIWNTVAVTNPNTTNNMCDIKFEFGKKIFDCHELLPNSWVYVPKDYHTIYSKIEEFANKA